LIAPEETYHLIGNQVIASSRTFAVDVGVARIENSPDSESLLIRNQVRV
jgi:hypothetical protein